GPAGAGTAGELLVSLMQPVRVDAGECRCAEIVGEIGSAIARVDGRDVAAEGVERRALSRERGGEEQPAEGGCGDGHAHAKDLRVVRRGATAPRSQRVPPEWDGRRRRPSMP